MRTATSVPTLAGFLLVASLTAPSGAAAQAVVGRVLDQAGGNPVDAVLVELLRPDSTRIRATLSVNGGRYSLALDGPGSYLIRLDRLGYRASVAGPFELHGDTAIDLRVAPQPVSIDPIQATGEGRCAVNPEEGRETARLWEQIRKVLAVTDVASTEGLLEFELLRFDRELDRNRSSQQIEILEAWVGNDPFQGYPASVLAEQGFVQPGENGAIYWFMPDADVILAPAFLDTHCFSVVERFDGPRRLLGLAFEPIDQDRDKPDRSNNSADFRELVRDDPADVEGVLWVDAASGALETLEYGYTGIRSDDFRALAGGYARFEPLSDGKWVIRQWWIRMPRFVARRYARRTRIEATGIRETGGELIQVRDTDGNPVTRRAGQPVSGTVAPTDLVPFDSLAIVRFSGTAYLTGVGPAGEFAFPDVMPGRYMAIVHHPVLDTLGLDLPVRSFNVGRDPVTLSLELPDRQSAIARICPRRDEDSDRGIVLVAVDRGQGMPVPNERVRLRSVLRERTLEEGTTAEDGRVRFCAVPPNEALQIVIPGHDIRVPVSVARSGQARRDIRVGG